MDIQEVEKKFEGTAELHLEVVGYHTKGKECVRKLQEMIELYEQLHQIVNTEERINGHRLFVLKREHREGILVGDITADLGKNEGKGSESTFSPDDYERYPSFSTTVAFQGTVQGVRFYSYHSEVFGARAPGSEPNYKATEEGEVIDCRVPLLDRRNPDWTKETIENTDRYLGYAMRDSKNTFDMLLNAACDERLNPDIAPQAQAYLYSLQQPA